ncbi:hypothetical protein E2562_004062 [Oryza meyeriana var. granulata]|uniref:Uncharacterized protein n=1 Tax=Oryza meyeriana var. granulata TaxID=110450 RepID=A0A6G1BJ34_9ORYZ|nr:hypothetical protein E2562_004062 [Oryza meyeriana var. granulata]
MDRLMDRPQSPVSLPNPSLPACGCPTSPWLVTAPQCHGAAAAAYSLPKFRSSLPKVARASASVYTDDDLRGCSGCCSWLPEGRRRE